MNKTSQDYQSYARRAAFDAGERRAMRVKALRPAFELNVILAIGLWLMWLVIPNSVSALNVLIANAAVAVLAYGFVWVVLQLQLNDILRRRIALLQQVDEHRNQLTNNRTN